MACASAAITPAAPVLGASAAGTSRGAVCLSSGEVHGPRLSGRSSAIGVDTLNADSVPCRADNTQTCRICRSLEAALPLPSNPARLLTVRCHPTHTESQTPFSQAERRLLSCAEAGTCNHCHTMLPRTARTLLRLNAAAPPANPTSISSSRTPANLPTPTPPRPQKPYEISSTPEALYVPIAKESREKPHSNPRHDSLPSGLPSQYDSRGYAAPNEVRRFIRRLPAASLPHFRRSPATHPPVEIHAVVQD